MQKMNQRTLVSIIASILGMAFIALLMILGQNLNPPAPPESGGTSSNSMPSSVPAKDSSDSNYTVLCIKTADSKIRFTRTGSDATCPADFLTVPVKLDPKLIRK